MLAAIKGAAAAGKGIYTMKALGGGHLIPGAAEALSWILTREHIAAVAVGMQSVAEVAVIVPSLAGQAVDTAEWARIKQQERRLLVEDRCSGCGNCAAKCPMQAIEIQSGQGNCPTGKVYFVRLLWGLLSGFLP